MKTISNSKRAAKRDLFAELSEGMEALAVERQGKRTLRTHAVAYKPPPALTPQELARRLRSRATESTDAIERRLMKAHEELKHYGLYDYLIVNDDLPRAYDQLRAVYLAAQCEIQRMGRIAERLVKEAEAS